MQELEGLQEAVEARGRGGSKGSSAPGFSNTALLCAFIPEHYLKAAHSL